MSSAEEPKSAVELTSLRSLHDKGVIDDDEYENAMRDPALSTGSKAEQANTLTVGGWTTTLYGFVEADMIYDSTQSFNEQAGNVQVERPAPFPLDPPAPQTTYRGDHDRLTFSVRNSRVGLSTRSPKTHGVSVSGVLEFDLLGSQPTIGYATPQLSVQNQGPAAGQTTEFATFATPAMRLRHGYFKVETPVVDVSRDSTGKCLAGAAPSVRTRSRFRACPGNSIHALRNFACRARFTLAP